jgi:hypothetical protein
MLDPEKWAAVQENVPKRAASEGRYPRHDAHADGIQPLPRRGQKSGQRKRNCRSGLDECQGYGERGR